MKQKPRKTFAIISHPDAGKTTLTEKLLWFGGAIRKAGSVKGKKTNVYATSDWMEIEKQRGISVTSSVLEFEYQDVQINILDTPGHQDFSEDTYRTLTAADSAVMLIDSAKGIEAQTLRLFEVCRARGIPIFTFINKMDRYGKPPLDLLDEIEEVLQVKSFAMNWPIGAGRDFRGIFNRMENRLELFGNEQHPESIITDLDDPKLLQFLEPSEVEHLREDIDLLDIAGDDFEADDVKQGKLTPVFFGSAITNFGVKTFLDQFIQIAPSPSPKKTSQGFQEPDQPDFSGFIFKIQSNMNPDHRDRIAFLRICSGTYQPGMMVNHVRTKKKIKLARPQQLFGQERGHVEQAVAGDVIGFFDPNLFRVGDTLCEKGHFQFDPLPKFCPEIYMKLTNRTISKYKQFHKGVQQLSKEGAIQVFTDMQSRTEDRIIGAVGQLQFEVMEYRLLHEYGVSIHLEPIHYQYPHWIEEPLSDIRPRIIGNQALLLQSEQEDRVILFKEGFHYQRFRTDYPELTLLKQK